MQQTEADLAPLDVTIVAGRPRAAEQGPDTAQTLAAAGRPARTFQTTEMHGEVLLGPDRVALAQPAGGRRKLVAGAGVVAAAGIAVVVALWSAPPAPPPDEGAGAAATAVVPLVWLKSRPEGAAVAVVSAGRPDIDLGRAPVQVRAGATCRLSLDGFEPAVRVVGKPAEGDEVWIDLVEAVEPVEVKASEPSQPRARVPAAPGPGPRPVPPARSVKAAQRPKPIPVPVREAPTKLGPVLDLK